MILTDKISHKIQNSIELKKRLITLTEKLKTNLEWMFASVKYLETDGRMLQAIKRLTFLNNASV